MSSLVKMSPAGGQLLMRVISNGTDINSRHDTFKNLSSIEKLVWSYIGWMSAFYGQLLWCSFFHSHSKVQILMRIIKSECCDLICLYVGLRQLLIRPLIRLNSTMYVQIYPSTQHSLEDIRLCKLTLKDRCKGIMCFGTFSVTISTKFTSY